MKDENIIYGIRPVIEAILAGKEIEKLLIQQGLKSEGYNTLRTLIKERNIIFQFVPIEKLNRISRKNHQGIICYISPIQYQDIENLIPMIYEEGKTPLVLILDKVNDVRNFGAIARTAECAGVDAIIIPERGSAMINSDAVKTSAGALLKIPVHRSGNLKITISFLKESGLQIISASEKAEEKYYDPDYSQPTAIIMGSEESGVSGEYLKLSDKEVQIPIIGKIQSLNVSVATGIIIYEALKQRTSLK